MVYTVLTGHSSKSCDGDGPTPTARIFLSYRTSIVSLCCLLLCLFVKASAQTDSDCLGELFGLDSRNDDESVYIRTQAPRNAFPFYVSLRKGNFDLHYCAGTLISPSYVVTSASCIDPKELGFDYKNVKAFVGAYELESEDHEANGESNSDHCASKAIKIENVTIHEKYRNGKDGQGPYNALYDIAILHLKGQAHVGWSALPLEVPEDCCDGVDFVNVGLGRRAEGEVYASSLEMAAFPFMPYPTCVDSFKQCAHLYPYLCSCSTSCFLSQI